MTSPFVTEEVIQNFIRDGFVVIPDVFSPQEVQSFRDSLHASIAVHGIRHGDMSSDEYQRLSRFGPHSQIFYPPWKLAVQEDPRMFGIMSTVFKHTFAEGIPGFESSFAGFNPLKGYSYIDRLAYRLPDSVASQGGLGLHVDCNPLQPCDDPAKWRPIQASVALTDCLTPSSGGLTVTPGMHIHMEEYVTRADRQFIKCANFTRLDKCPDLTDRTIAVVAPAGSMVLWDNRLPHGTAETHDGPDTREVLFMTFLPDVPRNRAYALAQLSCYNDKKLPPDFQGKSKKGDGITSSEEEPTHEFSPLGKCLMCIEPWPEEDDSCLELLRIPEVDCA